MASSLLRSTARELRRSIPPPRRPAGLLMEGFSPRLLSTDSSNQKMRPPSPNAISSLLFRSDCAKRMDTTKQFSKDDFKELNRYLGERMKQADWNLLSSFDKFGDACENRSCLL